MQVSGTSGFERWSRLLSNGLLWFGVSLFIFEAFFWLAFLSNVPLSQGVMMGSIDIISVLIGARLLFHEVITRKQTLAFLLIASGVAPVGWGQI